MIERGGDVVIRMLEDVQQVTIKPLIQATIAPGTLVYTDEYDIYGRQSCLMRSQVKEPLRSIR